MKREKFEIGKSK